MQDAVSRVPLFTGGYSCIVSRPTSLFVQPLDTIDPSLTVVFKVLREKRRGERVISWYSN